MLESNPLKPTILVGRSGVSQLKEGAPSATLPTSCHAADLLPHPFGQSPYYHYAFQRARLKHNLNSKGWNSHIHRGLPGKFESSNLSRDNVGREIVRKSLPAARKLTLALGEKDFQSASVRGPEDFGDQFSVGVIMPPPPVVICMYQNICPSSFLALEHRLTSSVGFLQTHVFYTHVAWIFQLETP